MELTNLIYEENNAEFRIEAWRDDVRKQIVAEGFQKVKAGIKYWIERYEKFDVNQFKAHLHQHGSFSSRPYELGQHCDGTIGNPVMALYHLYCKHKGIDPDELLAKAYPEENHQTDWDYILEDATWQETAYPEKWGQKEYEGLLESLTEVNYHSLHNQLSEMENKIPDKADTSRKEELKQVRGKNTEEHKKEFQR